MTLKFLVRVALLISALCFLGCGGGGPIASINEAPEVSIILPVEGSEQPHDEPVAFCGRVTDTQAITELTVLLVSDLDGVLWNSESDPVNPRNPYGLSKQAQERIAISLGRAYGIPTTCARYSIVQGPRQSFYNAYSGACRIFCLHAHFGRAPVAYEDGLAQRDFVNIHDVVAANLLLLEREETDGEVYNVGGGRAYTVYEFGEIVARVAGGDAKPPRITGEYRYGDTRHILSDVSKLRALGWEPKQRVEDSVGAYLAWLNEQVDVEDILDYAQKQMTRLGVVRSADDDG